MKARRYKKSYEIVTSLDEASGREKLSARYSGEWFLSALEPRSQALRAAPGLLVYWAATVAYLLTAKATSRCMYALMPVLFGLFPGFYALLGLGGLYACPRRMTVVQKENGPGRLTRSGFGCMLLSAAAAVGCAVKLSVDGLWPQGWFEPALTALAAAGAAWAFRFARRGYGSLVREPRIEPSEPEPSGGASGVDAADEDDQDLM